MLKSQKTKKFNLNKETYQYEDDQFDHFLYYSLPQEKTNKAAIVTIVLGGTPWSACIRRITQKLQEMNYDIYILPNPGTLEQLDIQNKCDLKDLILARNMYNLIKYINKNNKYQSIDLVGYSLGSFIIDDLMRNQKYQDILPQIGKILYGFVELEPMKQQKLLPRGRYMLGTGWADFCINNKQFLIHKGIPEENVDRAIKEHTVEAFYQNIVVYYYKFKDLETWYDYNSVGKHLPLYKIPTLFVFTNDDYVCKKFNNTQRQYMLSNKQYVDYVVFNYGNHIGGCLTDGSDIVCETFQQWSQQVESK